MTSNSTHAAVKIHPPILTLLCIASAYAAQWALPLPFAVSAPWRLAGFGLVVAGFLAGVAAFLEFRKARTTLNPHGRVSALVTGGIYRFSRNPIYLGFLLMLVGLPLNNGNLWGGLLAPAFVWAMNRLVIEQEEVYLEKKFQDMYAGYRSRVRRWL